MGMFTSQKLTYFPSKRNKRTKVDLPEVESKAYQKDFKAFRINKVKLNKL